MSYPPPHCAASPPSSTPSYVNGSGSETLYLVLGEIRYGQSQIIQVHREQTALLSGIHQQLTDNARLMSERLPEKPAPPAERMSVRDWVQIGIAIAIVLAAIAGKVPLKDVLPFVLKPIAGV